MALTGLETLQVLGQNPSGVPAATTFQTTTGAIASLAASGSTSTVITAISTVGAGTLTAASIVGKIINRLGTQIAAFTDTTDTATAILALLPSAAQVIGESFIVRYENNTVFPATITGGTGVTVSGPATLPANSWAEYLLTFTAITVPTITLIGFEQGYFPHVGTFTNNGTSTVTTADTNVTAGSSITITLKTVGGTVGAIPHLLTITPGTGFATVGTASDTSVYNYEIRG
jgi:hypothetical protein